MNDRGAAPVASSRPPYAQVGRAPSLGTLQVNPWAVGVSVFSLGFAIRTGFPD